MFLILIGMGLSVSLYVTGALQLMFPPQDVSRYLDNMKEKKDKYYSLPAIGGTTTSTAFRPTQYEKEIM